jgi:hypothetical protein
MQKAENVTEKERRRRNNNRKIGSKVGKHMQIGKILRILMGEILVLGCFAVKRAFFSWGRVLKVPDFWYKLWVPTLCLSIALQKHAVCGTFIA